MTDTTPLARARHLSPARKVQRITEDHDTLIQRAVAATGRTRQEIVNDALDVGMTLVLLQVREPHAARALVAEASYLVVRAYVGLADGGGPGDPVPPFASVEPVARVEPVEPVEPV